ncbi:MAG: exodeoxyribonuclease VII small subunit [Bacteroides sp.]|nr:exodeoxyribonuclease VII small subunit [Ruminococcus flavefaciens]MCM1554213.1 exodeoxyribonuclease VII small subunit [Bacteroides sp.]
MEKNTKTSSKKEKSYDKAFERLQEIVESLDAEEITVDKLTENLKEAVGLLAVCRQKLGSTEKEVQEILKGME